MSEIIVKVEGGRLRAVKSDDIQYPGIDIEFIPDKPSDGLSNPRVLFEKPKEGDLQVMVWADKENEDYTQKIKFN